MDFNDVLQHSPLVLYLVAVFAFSFRLLPPVRNPTSLLFLMIALSALLTTWYYMFRFLHRSYQDAKMLAVAPADYDTTNWLEETSLFKQAWEYVCATSERWWFSSQLCTFTTGVWTVFLFAEGTPLHLTSRRPDLRKTAWEYMILGQIVAISFSSSLFLALLASPIPSSTFSPPSPGKSPSVAACPPSRLLYITVILSLLTVYYIPFSVGTSNFLLNLLVMHAIILFPLFQLAASRTASSSHGSTLADSQLDSQSSTPGSSCDKNYKMLYLASAVISLIYHLSIFLPLLEAQGIRKLAYLLWNTLNDYPAQSSISWDVIWVNISWQTWAIMQTWALFGNTTPVGFIVAVTAIACTPILGAGVGIAMFLAVREDWLQIKRMRMKYD
ncbi:MAG: hypothetical protein CYPHOPRED_000792 [Cyphobasidiales sp. Tagirdzhanova-0007]|nr:MAG: hypothetical protein CYPHOPRED_000792 [Cyphobasidiales sp. Tagirdzhanova-0007]